MLSTVQGHTVHLGTESGTTLTSVGSSSNSCTDNSSLSNCCPAKAQLIPCRPGSTPCSRRGTQTSPAAHKGVSLHSHSSTGGSHNARCLSETRAALAKHSKGPFRETLPPQGAPTSISPVSSLQATNSQTDNHSHKTISPNKSQYNSSGHNFLFTFKKGHLPPPTLKHPFPSLPFKTSTVLAGSAALREAT